MLPIGRSDQGEIKYGLKRLCTARLPTDVRSHLPGSPVIQPLAAYEEIWHRLCLYFSFIFKFPNYRPSLRSYLAVFFRHYIWVSKVCTKARTSSTFFYQKDKFKYIRLHCTICMCCIYNGISKRIFSPSECNLFVIVLVQTHTKTKSILFSCSGRCF